MFSVIVATKDRGKDIINLLTSLKKSDIIERNDVEIIIVDNGSVIDDIKSITKKYGVRYLLEKTKGKSIALNKGIHKARGRYIFFTDDDVVITNSEHLDIMHNHFKKNKRLGYCSGDVIAYNLDTMAQKVWEKKGGLSKGKEPKYFSREYLNKFKTKPWPLTKICAGANCMIPRELLITCGGLNENFGPGAPIGHGESLLIGYEIIKRGFELEYDNKAYVFHNHPSQENNLKKKLFLYGSGDTALHMHIFFTYKDFRSLGWSCGGHQLYVFKNLINSFRGKYPLAAKFTIYSLAGSFYGPILYILRRIQNRGAQWK